MHFRLQSLSVPQHPSPERQKTMLLDIEALKRSSIIHPQIKEVSL